MEIVLAAKCSRCVVTKSLGYEISGGWCGQYVNGCDSDGTMID